MAENKKSFLAYADWLHTFESLKDNEAGKLIKVILQYVNDTYPEPTDRIVRIAFEPIKQQLKRDLQKWEGKLRQKSDAGINSSFNKFKNKILSNIEDVDIESEKGYCLKKLNESGWEDLYFKKCYDFLSEINEKETKLTNVESVATKSSVNDNVNVNVNDILLKEKNIKKENFSFRDAMIENGFNEKLVDDWLKVRKNKKATNTETALKSFLTEVQKSSLLKNDVLKICIEKSWSGFENQWLINLQNLQNGSIKTNQYNGHGQSAGAITLAHKLAENIKRTNSG